MANTLGLVAKLAAVCGRGRTAALTRSVSASAAPAHKNASSCTTCNQTQIIGTITTVTLHDTTFVNETYAQVIHLLQKYI